MPACRSGVWAVAVEAVMNNVGYGSTLPRSLESATIKSFSEVGRDSVGEIVDSIERDYAVGSVGSDGGVWSVEATERLSPGMR